MAIDKKYEGVLGIIDILKSEVKNDNLEIQNAMMLLLEQ